MIFYPLFGRAVRLLISLINKPGDIPLPYRFGWNNPDDVKNPNAPYRPHFLEDVRKGKGSRSTPVAYDLFRVSPTLKKRRNIYDVEFAEINILRNLSAYTASLSTIGDILKPTQEMVNGVAEEMARDEGTPPTSNPYLTPDLPAHPWLPRISLRANALSNWRDRVHRVPNKHDISVQISIRRHLRFVIDAVFCHDRIPFGGFTDQLPYLALALSIASTENCDCDISYNNESVLFLIQIG